LAPISIIDTNTKNLLSLICHSILVVKVQIFGPFYHTKCNRCIGKVYSIMGSKLVQTSIILPSLEATLPQPQPTDSVVSWYNPAYQT